MVKTDTEKIMMGLGHTVNNGLQRNLFITLLIGVFSILSIVFLAVWLINVTSRLDRLEHNYNELNNELKVYKKDVEYKRLETSHTIELLDTNTKKLDTKFNILKDDVEKVNSAIKILGNELNKVNIKIPELKLSNTLLKKRYTALEIEHNRMSNSLVPDGFKEIKTRVYKNTVKIWYHKMEPGIRRYFTINIDKEKIKDL